MRIFKRRSWKMHITLISGFMTNPTVARTVGRPGTVAHTHNL